MTTRRKFVLGALCGVLGAAITPLTASLAAQDGVKRWPAVARKMIDERPPIEGRVSIDAPYIVNPGDSLSVRVSVESPMTARDYVASVHIYVADDPWTRVASFYFAPQGCGPSAATRVTMKETGYLIAIAKMHDGALYMARHLVKVTANPYVR